MRDSQNCRLVLKSTYFFIYLQDILGVTIQEEGNVEDLGGG